MMRGRHLRRQIQPGRAAIATVGVMFGMVFAMSLQSMATQHQDAGTTPSTNEINQANGWAHFEVLDTRIGEVDVRFVSTRSFASCFEYRSDDEAPTSANNFNPAAHDGLWPFTCVNNSTQEVTLQADAYVEIRMVFGAESDERFDWTRVDVLEATKEGCKDGGWEELGFRNQGLCVAATMADGRSGH